MRFCSLIVWCIAWLVVAWAMLDPSPPQIKVVSDKTIHFASFFIVSFATIAFCRAGRELALAGAVCAVAAVGFETAQYFIPARAFEWGDIAANLGGTGSGILLAALSLHGLRRLGWPQRKGEPARNAA